VVLQLSIGPLPIEQLTQGTGNFREAERGALGGHFPDHLHFGDREVTTTEGQWSDGWLLIGHPCSLLPILG
jgi:hypothetical protein